MKGGVRAHAHIIGRNTVQEVYRRKHHAFPGIYTHLLRYSHLSYVLMITKVILERALVGFSFFMIFFLISRSTYNLTTPNPLIFLTQRN